MVIISLEKIGKIVQKGDFKEICDAKNERYYTNAPYFYQMEKIVIMDYKMKLILILNWMH